MSQPGDRVIDVGEEPGRGEIQSAQNQTHEPSDVSDSSGPIFNMYVKMAEEEDKKMTDRWQKDADGILIFAGLFSAAVAALVAVSIQDLKPNPQDTSAFYLKNILQLLANPNVSHASILATSIEPPPFSPPTTAIWVNTLWLLSLVSVLHVLFWQHCYTVGAQIRHNHQTSTSSPHRRARIRAFFRAAWFLYTGVSYGLLCILSWIPFPDLFSPGTREHFDKLVETCRKWFFGGILKATQEDASRSSTRIDSLVLKWTFDALVEDDELERFFEGIPGFCTSDLFHDPQAILRSLGYRWFGEALHVFHTRTLTSSLFSETARQRRLKVYDNAAEALDRVFLTYKSFGLIFHRDKDRVLQSVQMGHFLINRFHSSDHQAAFYAHGIVAGIIANVPRATGKRSDRWKTLVKDQLGISKMVLLKYLEHGDSVLLANLLYIMGLLFDHALSNQHMRSMLTSILLTISKFDIQKTLPELQHNFCALWNEITREAHNLNPSRNSYYIVFSVHRVIRHLYIDLHQGTDAAPTEFDASRMMLIPFCPTHSRPSTLHNVLESSSIIGSSNFQPPFNVGSTNIATTSPGPTTAVATERPTDTQIISSMVNSKSRSDPLPAATATSVPISSLTLPTPSVDQQHTTDSGVIPPSSALGIPLTSSPRPAPSEAFLLMIHQYLWPHQLDQPLPVRNPRR
ncbi:hypothetical protein BGW80DRAFT_1253369 [Lactifluus volemus]|nr:hypothetical protein BGW80DRAFT_1253369 [Lactifluus volemus]